MNTVIPHLSLKALLRLDGALCLVMGAALLALRDVLLETTGLPAALLTGAGLLLLPIGLFIFAVSLPVKPPATGLAIVVLGNALWVVASIGVLLSGFVQPTAFGVALVAAQAAAVALIATIEGLPASTA